ncbi:hypothetical protein AB0I60_00955 [Actinosynnema sp. NPDC050436]|uniref:hypothetical protein n=1 Tax=Actinosynnema sp. NPDC050436 TaxID=3155659 RepID=UPI0033C38D49
MPVHVADLRRLLDSDLPDAALVLVADRLEVVMQEDLDADRYRGATLVVSRDELLCRTGGLPVTEDRLAQTAQVLSGALDRTPG